MFDLIKKTGNIDNERAQINKALRAIAAAIEGIDIPTVDVTSVFGRTGAVVAEPGDYSMPQISGEVDNSQHGNRGGGDLHALATPTVHGFMSSADKAKVNAQPVFLRASRWTSASISTDPTSIPGMFVAAEANSKYSLTVVTKISTVDDAGVNARLFVPGGTAYGFVLAGANQFNEYVTITDSHVNPASLSLRGFVETGGTAGNIQLQLQRVAGTSATFDKGYMILTKL